MLVGRKNFQSVLDRFTKPGEYSCDTETTGLRRFQGDKLFSVILADDDDGFYFNFQPYPHLPDDLLLGPEHLAQLQKAFAVDASTWFLHNAKFDLHMLEREGLHIGGKLHCTQITARLIYNRHLKYSLDACVTRDLGLNKSDAVEDYIKKNKLWEWEQIPGMTKRSKKKFFDRVPFKVIADYGIQDAKITRALGLWQKAKLEEIVCKTPKGIPTIKRVYQNEMKLVPVIRAMESQGLLVDKAYCQRGYDYYSKRMDQAKQEFFEISGMDLVDSGKALAKAFTAAGVAYPKTEKGNPSFTDDILEGFDSPLAQSVRRFRGAQKNANTYFSNFLFFSDSNGFIHPDLKQDGTDTGRFSCANPNLQNLPKKEKETDFPIRRSFIPPQDFCLGMIDYDQVEYRLMLDYANESEVIDKILNKGLDVHTATGEKMNVSRDDAKTLNFLLLYGGGIGKLAASLNITETQAGRKRQKYFDELPQVRAFTRNVIATAEKRKQLFNWLGRMYHYPWINDQYKHGTYKGPNHLIQGGCADIIKVAMPQLHNFLTPYKSKMLMQIHDEILFKIHKSELDIVPDLVKIMEAAYPHKHLPLTAGVSYSWESWFDKIDGLPQIPGGF